MIFHVKHLSVLRQLITICFLFIPQRFLKAILALQRIFYRSRIKFSVDKMKTSTLYLKFKFSLILAFFNLFFRLTTLKVVCKLYPMPAFLILFPTLFFVLFFSFFLAVSMSRSH